MSMTGSQQKNDGYVQVAESKLNQLHLHHLTSMVDLSIAVPEKFADTDSEITTGFTEWIGDWDGLPVSIGWDWGILAGNLVLLTPDEIRTNIQLLEEDGLAQDPILCRAHLARWLETIPWRSAALQGLVQAPEHN